jgi:hypothetical protein
MYIETGAVRLSVLSHAGKEAVVPPKGSRHVKGDVVNQEAHRFLAQLMLS